MSTLLWIIISTFIISMISLIGIITLSIKQKLLDKIVLYLVAFSAGALIGGAFLHLIPESIELFGTNLFQYVIIGFIVFLFTEKILKWRHCHKLNCKIHTFAYMNLIGDAIHNFIDGIIIGASFVISHTLGVASAIAIAFHEIPQEIGDFGVLLHGGFKRKKAIFYNFMVSTTAISGGIIGYFLSSFIHGSTEYLLPFAAGGFLYIAASDLVPEIRKEEKMSKLLLNFIIFIAGILIMHFIKFL